MHVGVAGHVALRQARQVSWQGCVHHEPDRQFAHLAARGEPDVAAGLVKTISTARASSRKRRPGMGQAGLSGLALEQVDRQSPFSSAAIAGSAAAG